ncbi:MAG: hypothetical protein ACRD4Q_01720 [Candidatus Acidiferrales bacterium]
MDHLEAVADAIQQFEGWGPDTRSYRNRNPGNLRSSPFSHRQDADGYAIFDSLDQGYNGLLYDLTAKFCGEGRFSVGQDSTLLELFEVWAPSVSGNHPKQYATYVAHWLSIALGRQYGIDAPLKAIWQPETVDRSGLVEE